MWRAAGVFIVLAALAGCAAFPRAQESASPPVEEAPLPVSQPLLRRQVVAAQEQSARLEVKLTELSNRLKTLGTLVRELQGRQSRIEARLERLQREAAAGRTRPSPQSASLPRRVPPPPARGQAPPREKKKTKEKPARPASRKPQEVYNQAYRAVRDGKSEEAILRFRVFLRRFPRSRLAANAQYWLGESYYDLKEYPAALEEFEKVIRRHPRSRKVPDAYYKRGLTYLRLKDPRRAALEFEKLIETFPRHRLTQKAKSQLRALGRTGNHVRR